MTQILPFRDYVQSVCKNTISSGVLLFNARGEILILQMSYKDAWMLPGGMAEVGETPRETATREVLEETGLDIAIGRLLCVEYKNIIDDVGGFQFVFDGRVLSDAQIAKIRLDPTESLAYRFADAETALTLLDSRVVKRTEAALQARANDIVHYLEHGQIV